MKNDTHKNALAAVNYLYVKTGKVPRYKDVLTRLGKGSYSCIAPAIKELKDQLVLKGQYGHIDIPQQNIDLISMASMSLANHLSEDIRSKFEIDKLKMEDDIRILEEKYFSSSHKNEVLQAEITTLKSYNKDLRSDLADTRSELQAKTEENATLRERNIANDRRIDNFINSLSRQNSPEVMTPSRTWD